MMQHTQGPWRSKLKSTPFSDFGIYDNSGSLVATVAHNPRYSSAARRAADAHLMAASPELLAALKALRMAQEQDKYPSWEKGVPNFYAAEVSADAAIAKATGGAA